MPCADAEIVTVPAMRAPVYSSETACVDDAIVVALSLVAPVVSLSLRVIGAVYGPWIALPFPSFTVIVRGNDSARPATALGVALKATLMLRGVEDAPGFVPGMLGELPLLPPHPATNARAAAYEAAITTPVFRMILRAYARAVNQGSGDSPAAVVPTP